MNGTRNGRCLCGRITFICTEPPNWVAYCHCDSCRRNTASPATAFFGTPTTGFRWTGKPPETYASSPGVRRSFCGRCGTPMAYQAMNDQGEIHLYVATLDDPNALTPEGHVHVGEQLHWFEVDDALPRWETTASGQDPIRRGPRQP